MNLLMPRKAYIITPAIVFINGLLTLFMILVSGDVWQFSSDWLVFLGANYAPLTLGQGEWWRLLTHQFLHGSLLHYIMNSLVLVNIGVILEPRLGHIKYLLLYLICGVSSGLCSALFHTPPVLSVGASGAVFGLYGFFLAILTTPLVPAQLRLPLLKNTSVFIGINLALGFMIGIIDNAAHLGGLLAGIVMGYMAWILRLIR